MCFFYYLPINHSISSTSNQIIIIYQTGLIFVGAIVAYKTVFKQRNLLVKALDNCKDEDLVQIKESTGKLDTADWEKRSDQDKLIMFYTHIITNVIQSLTKNIEEVSEIQTTGQNTQAADQSSPGSSTPSESNTQTVTPSSSRYQSGTHSAENNTQTTTQSSNPHSAESDSESATVI